MTPNLLVVAFIGLFILFLIESIYFLKKKLSVGPQVANQEESQSSGKFILIGGLIIIVAVIASFGWFLLSNQVKKTPSSISTETIPTTVPSQPLSPSPSELVYSFPTVTEIPTSLTIVPTAKVTLTKTPTPTKIPSPTITPSPSPKKLSSTPTVPPVGGPIGEPQIITPTTTSTPTTAIVVVPKIPVAGTMEQTLVMFFLGLSSVALGLIL